MALSAKESSKSGLGALLGPFLALVFYAVAWFAIVLFLTTLLPDIGASKFWKLVTFWLAYALPAVFVPALAALTVGLFLGAEARRASYWTLLALLILLALLVCVWGVLSGGAWGVLATLVFAASAYVAWRLLRRAALDPRRSVG